MGKVESGLDNNASGVVCEASGCTETHEQVMMDYLRAEVAKGAEQAERGEFSQHSIGSLIEALNSRG